MGRAIKLILYYLAYQLLFIFLATGTDATIALIGGANITCLLYTSPSPRDRSVSRMPSSA